MRVNVYVPDDLGERVRGELPDVNVSAVVQEALRSLLGCEHHELECRSCGAPVDPATLIGDALDKFYAELLHAWQPLVDKGGTAEGAARVAKRVAIELGISGAEWRAMPRPPRSAHSAA